MSVIREDDFIDSVADALQFISYYHPPDFVQAVHKAWEMEPNPAAKDAMAQILINSRLCAEGRRPICQDTGIVTVFLRIGMDIEWDARLPVSDTVNEGVRRAYTHRDNVLRASILRDPAGARKNTGDNTPAVIHMQLVPGNTIDVRVAAKGGGSENKARLAMLNPSDSIRDWVVNTVPGMGAGWCPPGLLGIGIGGTAGKATLLAKESLFDPIDIQALRRCGPSNRVEELRLELMDAVNRLGIEAIRRHGAVYLMAVGGAAYLVSRAITAARVVAFPELGMEAVYEFEVKDMPVSVAVDTQGVSVHKTGPEYWRAAIEEQALELI